MYTLILTDEEGHDLEAALRRNDVYGDQAANTIITGVVLNGGFLRREENGVMRAVLIPELAG